MEEVLRQRLLRRIESLPEAQIYQVLDYIEFLESKYARASQVEPSMLQKFAEGMQDRLRKKAMNPATLREAFQLIAAADRVLADVSSAGKQILDELGGVAEPPPPRKRVGDGRRGTSPSTPRSSSPSRRPSPPPEEKRPEEASEAPREVGLGEEWTPHEPPSSGGS